MSIQVAVVNSEGKALEKGTWSTVTTTAGQTQKVVTFHVSENGETVLQEAYESTASDTGEVTQIAIEAYEGGEEFAVVEQNTEDNQSPENRWNNVLPVYMSETSLYQTCYMITTFFFTVFLLQ